MAVSAHLPVIGGLAIVAAVTGVSLGRAAVSEINPVYFQSSPNHFYSDLVPNRSSGTEQADAGGSDYLQADYAYSAAPTCTDCANYPVDTRPLHDKSVDGIDDGWSASAPTIADETAQPSQLVKRPDPQPANRAWIDRYMDYSANAEPVTAAAPAAAAQPAAPAETETAAIQAQSDY